MDSPFVQPAIVRLQLKQNRWIDVRRELTYGEHQMMFAKMRKQFGIGEPPVLDVTMIGRARMDAYIVAWSFTDPQGKPVALTPAALENLKTGVANEIRDALELHEETVKAENEAEKNAPDGLIGSSPTSPSVS
jgi:hypothetical protein